MKHKNSITQVYRRRDETVIPQLYRRAKELAEYPTTMKRLSEIAAELPVNQFFISDDAALEYIRNRYYRGKKKQFRKKYKARLFDAFYETFTSMMNDDRYKDKGLVTVTILALSRPAPCVGLHPRKIQEIYFKYRSRLNLQKNEKI